jgi:hypothetical protein
VEATESGDVPTTRQVLLIKKTASGSDFFRFAKICIARFVVGGFRLGEGD